MTLRNITIDIRDHHSLRHSRYIEEYCGSKNIRHLDALEVSIKSVCYSLIFKSHAKQRKKGQRYIPYNRDTRSMFTAQAINL